jgi:hypothetical protein
MKTHTPSWDYFDIVDASSINRVSYCCVGKLKAGVDE